MSAPITPSHSHTTMIEKLFLTTDTPEFSNDLAEEIRLFLPDVQIVSELSLGVNIEISVLSSFSETWTVTSRAKGDLSGAFDLEYPAVKGDFLTEKRHKKRCVKTAVFYLMKKLLPDAFVPWGSLTGIRPTKLLRDLESETGEEKAKETMLGLFGVDAKKYELTREILGVQKDIIASANERDIDIYIDIPYCKTKCLYCSFPSDVRTSKTDMRLYLAALREDIRRGAELVREFGYHVRTTYMGGGTPTVLTEDELEEIIAYARERYGTFGTEFTVEAGRPDTITRKKLEILKKYGANRISVNPQTMNDATLKLLGRTHTASEIEDCYYMAREIGFCINMDVIACLPGESERDLYYTLSRIAYMRPDNLTVHTLALKRSSRLWDVYGDEEMKRLMPSAETADVMVNMGRVAAHDMGMRAYYMYRQKYMRGNLENVGYCLPGTECVYNIDMMEETVSIMAHGAGSMSKRIFPGRDLRVERIPNPKDIATYIGKIDKVYEEKRKLFGE